LKPAIFHPKARETIQGFPLEIRREMGKAIFDLQKGQSLKMPLSRPMNAVAPGVEELRLRDRSGAYRAFYFARLQDRVILFHAFQKKKQTTSKHEIDVGRKRLREVLHAKI
jgi:phage-related protein